MGSYSGAATKLDKDTCSQLAKFSGGGCDVRTQAQMAVTTILSGKDGDTHAPAAAGFGGC